MNYTQAVRYFYSLGNEILTAKLGLRNISILLKSLGNPHRQFHSILIAGTNGKGSVAAFCESILRAGGYRTGLYTSPHLERIEERIQVNGRMISEEEFARLAGQVKSAVDRLLSHEGSPPEEQLERHPTYFEMVTALAFKYFAEQGIQIGVLEVGLGGKYDATNVVDPLVAIITNVDLDHQQYLGERLEQIAQEKAGIIKSRAWKIHNSSSAGGLQSEPLPVVYSGNNPVVDSIIQNQCQAVGARWIRLQDYSRYACLTQTDGRQEVLFEREHAPDLKVDVPLAGEHQALNALTAVCAIDQLRSCGYPVNDEQLSRGIASTRWPGRLEVIQVCPRIILDGAHNPAGARVVRDYLEQYLEPAGTVMVFGVMRDKAIPEMGRILFPCASRVVLTRVSSERSAEPEDVSAQLPEFQPIISLAHQPREALAQARQLTPEGGTILVVGSLFLVGEVRAALRRRE